jgi:Rieske 2Fe-2S family protein
MTTLTSPLLDHCPPTLPAQAYFDPAWFEAERARIWAREWVPAGRIDSFPDRTIRRVDVAGASVIVLRDGAELRAFHNVCRHRGAELCAAETEPLRGKLLTCPYHAWAYATDGRLVSTAFGTPTADFRKEDNGLLPVALRLWNGFVFLCLADTPPAFAPDIGDGDASAGLAALDNWPMDRLVVGHQLEATIACNWKIFWENYNECLHCPGIHSQLSARVPVYAKGIMSHAESAETAANPGPVYADGAENWTVSGRPCGPVFESLTAAERAEGHRFVTTYPGSFVVAHVDYVRAMTLTPISPEETRLKAEWLFLPETLARPDFDMADVVDFASTVIAEDAAACEMNQRGLRSPAYVAGRLMPQEFDIARFHRWVLDRVGADVPGRKAET